MFNSIEEAKVAIHNYALEKGWYTGRVKSDMEALMLAIGELSEAAEEYRDGKPEVYVCDGFGRNYGILRDSGVWLTQGDRLNVAAHNFKPEGISIEIVDCVIRLLDWAGWKKYDLAHGIGRANELLAEDFKRLQPVEFCFLMAKKVTNIYDATLSLGGKPEYQILLLVESCNNYIHSRGYNMMELIELKHNYNMNRAPRHGGKVI